MNDAPRVTLHKDGPVAHVRLARPEQLNAIDTAMFEALAAMPAEIAADPSLRAVVLAGEGRAFCAGLDLAAMAAPGALDPAKLLDRSHGPANLYQAAAMAWHDLAIPVIAAIHGACFGGGLQLALGADIRIAAPDARLAVMELKWGIVPDMGLYALSRGLVRDDVLRELVWTHREFSGTEAQALGFATRLSDDPIAEATRLAQSIAAQAPNAIRAAKRLAKLAVTAGEAAILLAESREQAALIGRPEQREAVAAGLAARAPAFPDPAPPLAKKTD